MGNNKPYDFLRTFNEDIYIVMGNDEVLDVYQYDYHSGKPKIEHTFNLVPTNFLGVSVFAEGVNEYLVIHDIKASQLCVFSNMSASNILE